MTKFNVRLLKLKKKKKCKYKTGKENLCIIIANDVNIL